MARRPLNPSSKRSGRPTNRATGGRDERDTPARPGRPSPAGRSNAVGRPSGTGRSNVTGRPNAAGRPTGAGNPHATQRNSHWAQESRAPKAKRPARVSSAAPAVAREEGEGERLQKVLSRAGLASRREAEDWIRAGRITVNGEPAVLGVRVKSSDQVRLDGRLIRQRDTSPGATAFIVHRSPGESLTPPRADSSAEETGEIPATAVIERLPTRAGRRFITISPMPRVDGGLELVTSDGELGVKLQRSVRHLVSQFSVRVLGELTQEQIENVLGGVLDSGVHIKVETCEPAGGEGANRWYTFVARGASGKEVRQLFERQGATVSRVQRTHLGPLTMERSLSRGHFREVTPDELDAILAPPPPSPEEG